MAAQRVDVEHLERVFGFRVSGFGSRVSGFGIRVSGFWFRLSGFGFGVSGFGFRVSGCGFRVLGSHTHPVRRQGCGKEEEREGGKELQYHTAM